MSRPLRSLFAPESEPAGVLGRAACEALTRRVLGFATADETRVTVESAARGDTRFAVSQVSTSGDDVNTTITIQSTYGKRSASVTTNKTDDASLAAAVRSAQELAKLTAENPEHMPEPGPQRYASVPSRTVAVPAPADRAAAVKAIADRARAAGFVATGYIESDVGTVAVANSRGLFAFDQTSGTSVTTTVRTPDGTGSGWAGANASTWGELDPAALGAAATEKAARSRNPVAVEPGRYTVVLEPTAVGNLVQLIAYASQARAADEGRSFFSKPGGGNKIGMKVVDARVTLVSDPADQSGALFTAEGLPTERVVWIENGTLRNLNYDRFWAQKTGHQPTSAPVRTLHLMGGSSSIPEMVASTDRGILVTRFWYIRPVDPRTILFTGLTRDGTFLIENGKVTHAVKNFRYNESPIFMLNNLEALGRAVRVSASEDSSPGASIIMPPIKAHDFTFTSLSDAV